METEAGNGYIVLRDTGKRPEVEACWGRKEQLGAEVFDQVVKESALP